MLVPKALPLIHFSDFYLQLYLIYPQIYLCLHCDVNDHIVDTLDVHEVVHTHDKFSYGRILDFWSDILYDYIISTTAYCLLPNINTPFREYLIIL